MLIQAGYWENNSFTRDNGHNSKCSTKHVGLTMFCPLPCLHRSEKLLYLSYLQPLPFGEPGQLLDVYDSRAGDSATL